MNRTLEDDVLSIGGDLNEEDTEEMDKEVAAAISADEVSRVSSLLFVRDMLARRRNSVASGAGDKHSGFPKTHVPPSPVVGPVVSSSSRAQSVSSTTSTIASTPATIPPALAHTAVALSSTTCSRNAYTSLKSSLPPVTVTTPAAVDVNITSPEAFQRVLIEGTVVLNAEQRIACKLLWRAMELREKHWGKHKKPDYYYGAFADLPSPTSRPPPERSEIGVPMILVHPERAGTELEGEQIAHGFSPENPLEETSSTIEDLPSDESPSLSEAAARPNALKTFTPHMEDKLPSAGTPGHHAPRSEPVFKPFCAPILPNSGHRVRMIGGVVHVFPPTPPRELGATSSEDEDNVEDDLNVEFGSGLYPMASWREWALDYKELLSIVHSPAVKSFAYRRLKLLATKFELHRMLNLDRETTEQKAVPHRDFYNIRKCDTHVHHSACMNQKHLLRFIKSKLRKEPDTVCIVREGKRLTLAQVFESLQLTAYDLSIDTLDMHADFATTFARFDRFNLKYNPIGQARLREIFLKTSNMMGGRFLAEITREVFSDLEVNKYQLSEYRLSIYGQKKSEWSTLANWVVSNNLASPCVRWMIQCPRLYEVYKANNTVNNFGELLDNFFTPLFEVSIDPSVDPQLHQFLTIVSGIDLVDDESKPEISFGKDERLPLPHEWTFKASPPYQYWTYFFATNIAVLNKLRASRGLTQLSFRPHAGEAGNFEHLAATFLTAEHINHGINLKRSPPLQYLYYLAQIGLAMSPLSNNRLFLKYTKNPVADFFAKGLNVSLSTDDPLMLHYTREPLVEEFAVAVQVFKFTSADMAELARNSVLQSGFEYPFKAHWIGANYAEPGPDGNDISLTNLPLIRTQFRLENWAGEVALLREGQQECTDPHMLEISDILRK